MSYTRTRTLYKDITVVAGSAEEAAMLAEMQADGWTVYDTKEESEVNAHNCDGDYSERRYGKWRDFDSSQIVKKLTYTSSTPCYYYYNQNSVPYVDEDGYFGCFYNITKVQPATYAEGIADSRNQWMKIQKRRSYQECKDMLTEAYNNRIITVEKKENAKGHSVTVKETMYVEIDGKRYAVKSEKYINWKKYDLNWFLGQKLDDYYNNQGKYFVQEHPNYIYQGNAANTTAGREVDANAGLVANHSSKDCNPTWSGVNAFSIGEWSCGKAGYNKGDPSKQDVGSFKNAEDCKDEMHFELTAELTQEDILDIINKNPMSIIAGSDQEYETDEGIENNITNNSLVGKTNSLIDGVQVRVIRLTPCYINGEVSNINYTYNDVVKWSYLKTYCIDKQKLIDDIEGVKKGNIFPRINCNTDTFNAEEINLYDEEGQVIDTLDVTAKMIEEGSVRWNEWNIDDYKQKPLSDEDQNKLVTLAVKCYPDKLGYMSNSLDKINVTAHAITPGYKASWVKYWHEDNNEWYCYDSYDDDTSQSFTVPNFEATKNEWYKATPDDVSSLIPTSVQGVSYELMNNPWDKKLVPQKIEKAYTIQQIFNSDGSVYFNADGNPEMETIKYGNNWLAYIRKEMARYVDSSGRWIASDSFLNTFTDKNAILQAVNLMIGNGLGKDSYGYNALQNDKFIRLWYHNEDDTKGSVGYYFYDTDCTDINDVEIPYFTTDAQYIKNVVVGDIWKVKKDVMAFVTMYRETQNETEYNDYINHGWTLVSHKEITSPYTYYDDRQWYYAGDDLFNEASPEEIELGSGYYWSVRKVTSDINPLALLEAAEYTDNISISSKEGGTSYKCNIYQYQQQKAEQLLSTILFAARAFWVYDEMGRYEFHNDKPLSNPVLLITDENTLSASNSRSFSNTIAGYHVVYSDEDNNFQKAELYCLREGQTVKNHTKDIKDLTLTGVTNTKQAWDLACYLLGCTITQREIWTRKLNHVGNSLSVGSLVEVQNTSLEIGTDHSGRILQLIEGEENGITYIYGFVVDGMYSYRCEYLTEDDVTNTLDDNGNPKYTQSDIGRNVQAVTLMQPENNGISRNVTLRMATLEMQTNGVVVNSETYGTVTYKNVKGETNLVLLEKKIIKDKKRLVEQESLITDKDLNVTSTTMYSPKIGDIVAFGNAGVVTVKAVVFSKTPDEKGCISVSLYPYYDSLYTSGDGVPEYKASMTKRPIENTEYIDEAQINSFIELTNSETETQSKVDNKLNSLVEGGEVVTVGNPDDVSIITAKATRDYIQLNWNAISANGLRNTLAYYKVEMTKDITEEEPVWTEIANVTDNSCQYIFKRTGENADGYPEASAFANWKFRVKAVNAYDKESEQWADCYVVTSEYGTWIVQSPVVTLEQSKDRKCILQFKQPTFNRTIYGNIRYRVRIKRGQLSYTNGSRQQVTVPADSAWSMPLLSANPYTNESNYKTAGDYVESSETYVQVLPLYGQGVEGEGRNLCDTPYIYDVQAFNEASHSDWLSENGDEVTFVATVTSLRDVVRANAQYNELISEKLSAITANLGEVTDGSLMSSPENFWTLSTKDAPQSWKDYKGAFCVGNDKQYIRVTPVFNAVTQEVTDYKIELKAGSINLTTDSNENATEFEGGTYVYNEYDKKRRMKITNNGLQIQYYTGTYNESSEPKYSGGKWLDIGKFYCDSNGNMIITNESDETKLPSFITEIAASNLAVYHFIDDLKDNTGGNSLNCEFTGTLSETKSLLNKANVLKASDSEAVKMSFNTIKQAGRSKIVAFTKSDYIRAGDDLIHLSDSSKDESLSLSDTYLNSQANTGWGLTSAQVSSKLFKMER